MARYYNEDWERKKSYLIRSLFHDIPRLSTVTEETQSTIYTTSESSVEDQTESLIQAFSNITSYTAPFKTSDSTLPPLIIERMPNKHDETAEYYKELLTKMRIVYKSMFLYTSNDYLVSDDQLNLTMVDSLEDLSDFTEEKTASFDSIGYNADLDSIVSYCDENDDVGCESLHEDVVEREAEIKESEYRQVTIQAEIHKDGTPIADIIPSPIYETTPLESLVTENLPSNIAQKELLYLDHHTEERMPLGDSRNFLKSTHVLADNLEVGTKATLAFKPICDDVRSPILSFTKRKKNELRRREIVAELENCNPNNIETNSRNCDAQTDFQQVVCSSAGHCPVLIDGGATIIEDNHNLNTISTQERNTSENYEEMRTQLTSQSQDSTNIDHTRLTSDMDITCEYNTSLRDITNITAESQTRRVSDRVATPKKVSNDVDDILAAIFNDSCNEKRRSRKRNFTEMSAQTENVTWNNLKDKFFLGTPKIFRLCSCSDHFCN